MDKLASVQQKKATKQAKAKKKPVKVVYISNPMKIKTSASEFRALVQELTGQDADMPDPTKYSEIDGVDHDRQTVPDHHDATLKVSDDALDDHVLTVDPTGNEVLKRSDNIPFGPYDDFFTPQMLENFTGTLLPSSLLYESAQLDVIRGLDAM
ncbi:sigma factor binding protein 1, chloroplastic-like [Cornus florida]|uniref:sigma factor binding protein 1, chloroplastic-like n=1 Tax=Cornus florida TaxID=4283 RepID=UPI0028A012F6|nr:sigma factor binding protein 1, chloroplastic-like [Cornus florida]